MERVSKLYFDETKKEAEDGNPEKQYFLAWIYDWGQDVRQDMKKAIEWFVRSAYNGRLCRRNLASCIIAVYAQIRSPSVFLMEKKQMNDAM